MSQNNKLIIIGAGSLGVMTLDIALEMNKYKEIYFLDDSKSENEFVHTYKVLGGIDTINALNILKYDFVISIANNATRKKIAEKYNNLNFVNIIHPKSSISRFSQIGKGNIILPNVSIDPETIIHDHTIINKNTSLGHNVIMKNYAQSSPGCQLGGKIGELTFIGLGATVLPNINIGANCIIGAGAVVTENIPANVTAVGVPARVIKER